MEMFTPKTEPYGSVKLLPTNSGDVKYDSSPYGCSMRNISKNCRLCLEEIKESSITLLDGIIRDMLEIILPELKLNISEYPAICKNCLETLKQAYTFKSACLEVEDRIQDFVNPQFPGFIDLKEVVKKFNNSIASSPNGVICRTCLGISEDSSCTKLCSYEGDPLKNMVEKCLPEMGIELTKDPILCSLCLEQLEEQFNFIMQCLDTEEKINYYCEVKNSTKNIDLRNVYMFSMCIEDDTEIRAITDTPIEESSLKEPLEERKTPDIIPTIDLSGETPERVKKCSSPVPPPPSGLDNIKIHLFETKEVQPVEQVTFELNKDGDGEDVITSTTSRIDKNDGNDSDGSNVSVLSIEEILKTKYVENVHAKKAQKRKSNQIETKDVKNSDVGKEKKEKESSKEDIEESDDGSVSDPEDFAYYPNGAGNRSTASRRLRVQKCKYCNFRTKFRSRMKAHITVQHKKNKTKIDTDENSDKSENTDTAKREPKSADLLNDPRILRCKHCNFKTTILDDWKKHRDKHIQDRTQACPICKVLIKRPVMLQKHMDTHKAKGETEDTFTIKLRSIKHQDSSKTKDSDTSQTTAISSTSNLKDIPKKPYIHLNSKPMKLDRPRLGNMFSMNGKVLKMFKCQFCPYQSRMKSNLVKHSQSHNKTSELPVHKCKICNFETIQKENFLSHMQRHRNDAEMQVKKCFLCSFRADTEEALRKHVDLVHKSGTG